MELSDTAQKIYNRKYARTLSSGRSENWEQTVSRVAHHVASAEESESDQLQYTAEFVKIMYERSFLPGGRIIANAGTGIKNLMNCFVLPVEDTRESIYKTLGNSADVFAWGGGVGYDFSKLRPRGAVLKTTGSKASGPLAFMELFDTTGEIIAQASRRGAQMGILSVTHPDIVEFIKSKNSLNRKNKNLESNIRILLESGNEEKLVKTLADSQLTHFNISVAITDKFMEAFYANKNWEMSYKGVKKEMPARDLMNLIAENAWSNGDPGLYFVDRANRDNIAPYLGELSATNPCGEVPLLPYEACCLGSINLYSFVDGAYFDYPYLKDVVRLAVRFLDNVQTISETSVEAINTTTKLTRRLGLGVMGWADVLAEMGLDYDSEKAQELAEGIGGFIEHHAWQASVELAEEKGNFEAYVKEYINWDILESKGVEKHANLRNVAVTSIAPNGTIALISDVNSGIEPFFSRKYIRNITDGESDVVKDSVEQIVNFDNVKVAHEISPEDHIKMQAAWQRHTDNAISKTINMPESATVDDIVKSYVLAHELGCKGITVYRNNSRSFQILN